MRSISLSRLFHSVCAVVCKGLNFLRVPSTWGGMEHITVQTRSRLTGKLNEMVLFVDQDALERWLETPPGERRFVQDEFPHLSDDEREFLLTGSTPDEWDEAFAEDK